MLPPGRTGKLPYLVWLLINHNITAEKQYKAFDPFSIIFLLDCDVNYRVNEFKLTSHSTIECVHMTSSPPYLEE